jgi:molybdate transport system permease protein
VDWTAAVLTLTLATSTTIALLLIGLPLAAWLSRTRFRGRFLVDAAVSLPLVLPPTVLGFYLLRFSGPDSVVGRAYQGVTGGMLPFSFQGILLASIIFNFPFAVRPFTAALVAVDASLVEASWCLGVSRWRTFWRIRVPLAWPGILSGVILSFAHTVGEFGVVLMVGGNIPGVTRTLSVSIYDDVQALDYERANTTALVLLIFSFAVLAVTSVLNRGRVRRQ